jgi:Mg-chelatase subunit ChlD
MGYHHKLLFARLAASGLAKSALKKGDRIGVVTFNDLGRAVIPLTEIKEDIFEHIIELTAGGNTNIGDGIKCAAEMLMRERNHNQKFIVLITDGEPTAISSDSYARVNSYERVNRNAEGKMSEKDILTQTRKAATKGIKTSVIHCTRGGGNHRAFVKNIARLGAGRVIKITSMDDLRALMA